MKIGNSADQTAEALRAAATSSSTGKAGSSSAAGAPVVTVEESTKVQLSGAASDLSAASGNDAFDAEKVARMQQAIADGTYVISPDGIASKLIANARELLDAAGSRSSNG